MKELTSETNQNNTSDNDKEKKSRRVARGAAKVAAAGGGLLAFTGLGNIDSAERDSEGVARQIQQVADEGTLTVESSYDPTTNSFTHVPATPERLEELSDDLQNSADKTQKGISQVIVGASASAMAAAGLAASKKSNKE